MFKYHCPFELCKAFFTVMFQQFASLMCVISLISITALMGALVLAIYALCSSLDKVKSCVSQSATAEELSPSQAPFPHVLPFQGASPS